MSRDMIAAFLDEMRSRYGGEIESVHLPDGTRAYLEERVAAGEVETLEFMLKLGYLMGLQTGFAAAQAGASEPPSTSNIPGPIQA